MLIDTAGCDCEEDEGEGGGGANGGGTKRPSASPLVAESKSNTAEARVVGQHVRALLAAGLRHGEIGVITPYNAQVRGAGRGALEGCVARPPRSRFF